MKTKTLYSFASAVLLSAAFASCTDEMQEVSSQEQQVLKQIVMTTQDFVVDTNSRTTFEISDGAVNSVWAKNDTVGVFPHEGAQAYFPMTSEDGTQNATFDGKGWALKDGSTYGAYYPFIGKMYLDRNAVPVNYAGQVQTGNNSVEHLGAYDYMAAVPVAPQFGSAHFMFKHLSAMVQLRIKVPTPDTFRSVKLVAETKAFTVEGTLDIMADAPCIISSAPATEVELELHEVATTEKNQTLVFYFMLPPADLSEQTLQAVLTGDKGNLEVTLEGKNFLAGTAYGLSGEIESTEVGYKDGVVTISEAGTMKQFLGDNWLNITSLKVVGPINGDDVLCLRQMLGGSEFSAAEKGKLATLDLSNASIVEGGKSYYSYPSNYNTSNDVIGSYMFYQCFNLQNIVLPDEVTSIGKNAFWNCYSLISVEMGDGVTSIGDGAFSACYELTSIEISNGVTEIGSEAFRNCEALTSLDIPDGVIEIGDWSFYRCYSLTSINLPSGITSIGERAFNECTSLTFIHIPASLTSIGSHAFSDCTSLTSINIPDGVTEIGEGTFYYCYSLTSIKLPDGLTKIGKTAFEHCSSLASVNMPAGVTSVGEEAFYGCSSLMSIYIEDLAGWCNITFVDAASNPLYKGAKLYLNNKELTELTIPSDIKKIKDYAFYGCKSIRKITMGEGATSVGERAFYGCSSLVSVNLGTNITLVGIKSFRECSSLTQVSCLGTKPPTINPSSTNSSFNGSSVGRTLYVPIGCISAYQTSDWASFFGTIKEME